MLNQGRGRPKLDEAERTRRGAICREWAAEIKKKTGFSANRLADEFGYTNGRGDGRPWRALANGTNTPSPKKFKQMTEKAFRNGWLEFLGYLRYESYWNPVADELGLADLGQHEELWRNGVFGRAVLMMLAHARQSGISYQSFFRDAGEALLRIEKALSEMADEEIMRRARQAARPTVQELLDGPQYPETSLILEGEMFSVADD